VACEYVDEIVDRPHSAVPHYLPGRSPFDGDFAYRYGARRCREGRRRDDYPEAWRS
jgi:hypothetical protein